MKQIIAACHASRDADYVWPSRIVEGIDLSRLNKVLAGIDHSTIRKRRTLYSKVYQEGMISQEPGKGISFSNMLLMLAHHKLIDDREALV